MHNIVNKKQGFFHTRFLRVTVARKCDFNARKSSLKHLKVPGQFTHFDVCNIQCAIHVMHDPNKINDIQTINIHALKNSQLVGIKICNQKKKLACFLF